MARLNTHVEGEDSEGELPSLQDLSGKSKESKTRAKAPSVSPRKTTSAREKASNCGGRGIDVRQDVEVEKPAMKKKKRVLSSRAENPLLRPLDLSLREKEKGRGGREGFVRATSSELRAERHEVEEFGLEKPSPTKRTIPRTKSRSVTPLEKTIEPEVKSKMKVPNRARTNSERSKAAPREPESESVSDSESEHYDSDGLSDFIVDDLSLVQEEDSMIEMSPPPPRSTRKLVQGRRPRKEESDDDLDLDLQYLSIKDDGPKRESREVSEELQLKTFAADLNSDDETSVKKNVPRRSFEDVNIEPPKRAKECSPRKTSEKKLEASSDIEDPFTLRYSPSSAKPKKSSKEIRFATPPGSPTLSPSKPTGLKSPTKRPPKIPSTPHRQSTDAFWQQDVINEWNDEYSPRKEPRPQPKSTLFNIEDPAITSILTQTSPQKLDRAAKEAKKAFDAKKHDIASSFLKELDDKITNGQIAALSASTGGVKIIWSKKLNTTAGRANWKRETVRPSSTSTTQPKPATIHRHHATIELAEKVISDQHRLLNVLAHEFCHLANFMISNIKNNPHGREFKIWASKCSNVFKDRGIEVTTKHSYEIEYKYEWECGGCGMGYQRHSKSIDPKRHLCGSCKGRLVQTKPKPRLGKGEGEKGEGKQGGWEKNVSVYQKFVKDNMKRIKVENPQSPQKEIMQLVGKRWREVKESKLKDGVKSVEKEMESVEIEEGSVGEDEADVIEEGGDEMENVERKLVFLDLSGDSP